ncbi:MAG: hypothetical protein QOC70_2147 [Verrucomicrobiota bacterium]|jgi:hypothetical protein
MIPSYDDFLIKRFEQPGEVRALEKGFFLLLIMLLLLILILG